MDSCVIDGSHVDTVNIVQARSDLEIKGFKIIGTTNGRNVVSISTFHNLNISNCLISNGLSGIYTSTSSGIIDGVIINNVNTGILTFCYADTCKPKIINSIIDLRNSNINPDGINSYYGGRPVILNNIILGNDITFGIYNLYVHNVIIKNNLIAGCQINIRADGVTDSQIIVNNILRDQVCNNYDDAAITRPTSKTFIRNNILINNENAIQFNQSYFPNSDYNIFWNNERNVSGYTMGTHDRIVDPMFVLDTIAGEPGYDYHLQMYSPGIDAGDPSILDVDGSRSDIGMYGGPLGTSYSYLDLPPSPPVNFIASIDSCKITINWNKYSEADFSHYNIHRSTINNFTPDSSNFYAKIDTSFFIDAIPQADRIYYRIVSEDLNGNKSNPGVQIVVTITDAGETEIEILSEYNLYQNYPNPFNLSTTIPFQLKERSYVKLMIYDLKGELIKTLVNEVREKGYYTETYNSEGLASGIYLYSIEVIGKGSIPVFSYMKKMILVK